MALQDYSFYSKAADTKIEDYLKKSYVGNMIRYAPNGTSPIFALTDMAGAGQTTGIEHGYFSKTMVFPKTTVTAGANDSATSLTVDDSTQLLPADMLLNMSTGEILRVMTVPSKTSITVMRAVSAQPAAAIAGDQVLYNVGNAHEQGSVRPPSRLINPVRVVNFTQIFRNAWALPGSLDKIPVEAGNSLPVESRTDCGMLHAQDIEKALIFGQKSQTFVNGQFMGTMDGIVETVRRLAPAANTTASAGATTTYEELEEMLEPVFDTTTNGRNGNERALFVGGQARKVINQIGRMSGQYQIVDGQTNFGLQFQTFKTSRGTFRMIEHPLLNSNDDWKKMALALDLPSIRLMYWRRTIRSEYNIEGQPAEYGVDAVGGSLLTELTTEIVNPSAHAVIYGLTKGAASS